MLYSIKVAARASTLSRRQVEEVQRLYPHIVFDPVFVKTVGDHDRKTSLRSLDKTDFFTREVDQLVLSKECRIAVHSAKDLPESLPEGIALVALTDGIDPSDSVVLREGMSINDARTIATSSERREEMVRALGVEPSFVDIRGTIEERLAKIDIGEIDGVVVAEAALIRLGLTHLNRIKLPGETAPLQGRLAIVAHEDDREIFEVF